ncbi:MAG TPA: MFS transporter [Caulobacteraceae bacterium]|nr:MFS transporter [Caulobacteraceae bacterium]
MIAMAPEASAPSVGRRQVAAAVVGNALEFYDFITYATFAVQIGRAFFPGHSEFFKLMGSLVTFGVGFATRPLGAIVLGRLGDRVGRRPAMTLSFALMGVGLVGLVLTPGYASIGPLAPILVVGFRLIQGFALGGEVGPTTAFLIEAAPPERRGLYGGWQIGSQGLATFAGALVGMVLTLGLGAGALEAWGWRLALGLGAVILPVGYLLRRNLVETLALPDHAAPSQPAAEGLAGHGALLTLALGLIGAATIATYVFNFMTTYAATTLKLPTSISLAASVVVGAANFAGAMAGGALSDRLGRRWLLIWPRLVFVVVAVPAFQLMVTRGDAATLLTATAVLVFLNSASSSAALTAVTESTHKAVRSIAVAAVYATAVAVLGGSTQPIIAALIHATGDPLAPAWYMAAASVVGLLAGVLMRESAPSRAR